MIGYSLIVQFASFQYLGSKKKKKQSSFFIPGIQKEQSLLLGSHSKLIPSKLTNGISQALSLSLLIPSCTEQQIWQEKAKRCQLLYWASSLPNELRTSVLLASDASDESRRLATKWKQSFLLESAGRYNNVDVMHSVCCRSHISKAWKADEGKTDRGCFS